MMVPIKTFSDGSKLFFDKGRFDNWCVYFQKNKQVKHAPKDVDYFKRLAYLARKYGSEKIYDDFLQIYELTTSQINDAVLEQIGKISQKYQENTYEIDVIFTIIYAGMVAEENKENAVLKKRIKRLGIHQVLIDKIEPTVAATFSRGKKWPEINYICTQKGF